MHVKRRRAWCWCDSYSRAWDHLCETAFQHLEVCNHAVFLRKVWDVSSHIAGKKTAYFCREARKVCSRETGCFLTASLFFNSSYVCDQAVFTAKYNRNKSTVTTLLCLCFCSSHLIGFQRTRLKRLQWKRCFCAPVRIDQRLNHGSWCFVSLLESYLISHTFLRGF